MSNIEQRMRLKRVLKSPRGLSQQNIIQTTLAFFLISNGRGPWLITMMVWNF